MAKIKAKKKSFWEVLEEHFGTLVVGLLLVLYVLIMTNGYFNISITKRYCFYGICIFTVFSGLLIKLVNGFNLKKLNKPALITGLIFLVSVFIAFLQTEEKSEGLWGITEYGVGLYYFIFFLLTLLVLSMFSIKPKTVLILATLVSTVETVFAFVQFMGFDAFHLRENIGVYSPDLFVSTLGNLGFFGCFMVMMLPISIYIYIDDSIKYKWFKILSISATSVGIIISNTDATVLAALLVFLFSFFAFRKDSVKIRNYFEMLIAVGACWLVLGILWKILPNYLDNMASFYSLQKIMVNPVFATGVIVVGILGLFLIKKNILKIRGIEILGRICQIVGILVIPVIATVITIYTILRDPYSKIDYIPALLFTSTWGSDRGFIWHAAREMICDSTLKELIFGHGMGSFSEVFLANYSDFAMNVLNAYFNDAHNIYLQWLYEYGIVGLAALIGSFVMALKQAFNSNSNMKRAAGISIIAFMVASGFLVTQCITPVFIFIMFAIVLAEEA